MSKAKYYDGVEAAQRRDPAGAGGALQPFDFEVLDATSPVARLSSAVSQSLIGPIYAFSRRFRPILPLAGLLHVTREAQVRDILLRPDDFHTPFGPEMTELGGGPTFLLGLEGPGHDRQHQLLRQVIQFEDATRVGEMARNFATGLLENCGGSIDVIRDLLKRVPSEICLRYFGLRCDDIDAFGDWTMAVSAMLFGDPYGDPKTRTLALNGARRLSIVIDDAIMRMHQQIEAGHLRSGQGETLIERLVLLQQEEAVTDAEIRAILLGLATGFIPTNTLAAARMLQVLLSRPEAMAMARAAAHADDIAAMRKIVLEAGRLNPALAPGQWRYCPRDTTVDIDGRAWQIKAGSTLLVSTMSALRDPRAVKQPTRFWPERTGPDGQWQDPELVFGLGAHQCMGKHLAIEQISALFSVLLKQPDLKPAPGKAGRLRSVGPFPRQMEMTFTTNAALQSMFLVIAPVVSGATQQHVDAEIAGLGHPAVESVRRALDATGVVHFTSIATIQSDRRLDIVWELSVDGPIPDALKTITQNCGGWLRTVFAHAGLRDSEEIGPFLRRHVVNLHGSPWGATGLDYNGVGEFPVAAVERQAKFARFVERVVTDFLSAEAHRGSHPMLALNHVRRILSQDRILALNGTDRQRALMGEAQTENFDAFCLKPDSARLKLASFRPVTGTEGLAAFFASREAWVVWQPATVLFLLFGLLFWRVTGTSPAAIPLWAIGALLIKSLLATAAAMVAIPTAFFLAIRAAESRDWVDESQAPLERIEALGRIEDAPGYAQNHILTVGDIKPGLIRACAYAFSLWAIRMVIQFNYRPGFVINMGTIHYARWWRLPGTNKTAFYSNYDGSWESYLEDFITRARWGQTAVWSNWKGFPPTKFLIFSGAKDGDRFKRWVRARQQVVPFWYSRFPSLTTDQIRNNALIHSGVARVQSGSEAEEWLRCFGSMPRVENRIETDEVQALAFTGLKRLKFSASIVVALPPAGPNLGEWLSWIRGEALALDDPGGPDAAPATGGLLDGGVIVPAFDPAGAITGYSLAQSLTVTFGDRPLVSDDPTDDVAGPSMTLPGQPAAQAHERVDAEAMGRRALFLGVSAAGLARFTPPNTGLDDISETFPQAFRVGMSSRGRSLGDLGEASAVNWRWGDSQASVSVAEAVLFIYSETADDRDFAAEVHSRLLENHGGRVIDRIDCAPARIDQPDDQHDFEHFGYRDGISQPVVKGSRQSLRDVPERDILEPGEFILGYGNGQGFFPRSPLLPAEADLARSLPQLSVADLSRFPDFDAALAGALPCDFGRNGTFVAIRKLRQDVDGFEAFVTRKAAELRGDAKPVDGGQIAYRDIYKVIGRFPDRDWIKAKLMGRWPNGRPLVGNPENIPSPGADDPTAAACRAAEHDNDFSFGKDDPQGLACPLGAHIRRANPRDSKQPGDPQEQSITNRHRLLRRGRAYVRQAGDGSVEKGLLFVSLCADLERQFEFVQQAWVNSPAFHGLSYEPDPFMGADIPDPETGRIAERGFSIPTAVGSLKLTGLQSFVRVMAGGYFFLPSRSALTYLTDISLSRRASG